MDGKYKSELAAKRAAASYPNSCIVDFRNGTYDWFPQGHPIGEYDGTGKFIKSTGHQIVARCRLTLRGDYKWQTS